MNPLMQSLMAQKYSHTLTELIDDLSADPEAVQLFAEFHPTLWNDLAEQGYTCLELGQASQASRIFSFLLEYHNDEVAFHAAYADAMCSCKEYLVAAEYYNNAREMAPQVPDAFFYLSELYMMFRQPHFAKEHLEQVQEQMTSENHPLAHHIPKRIEFAEAAMKQEGAAQ